MADGLQRLFCGAHLGMRRDQRASNCYINAALQLLWPLLSHCLRGFDQRDWTVVQSKKSGKVQREAGPTNFDQAFCLDVFRHKEGNKIFDTPRVKEFLERGGFSDKKQGDPIDVMEFIIRNSPNLTSALGSGSFITSRRTTCLFCDDQSDWSLHQQMSMMQVSLLPSPEDDKVSLQTLFDRYFNFSELKSGVCLRCSQEQAIREENTLMAMISPEYILASVARTIYNEHEPKRKRSFAVLNKSKTEIMGESVDIFPMQWQPSQQQGHQRFEVVAIINHNGQDGNGHYTVVSRQSSEVSLFMLAPRLQSLTRIALPLSNSSADYMQRSKWISSTTK